MHLLSKCVKSLYNLMI